MNPRFTAVYERHGAWWIVSTPEVPGALAQGATLGEARENLQEAVALILEANRDISALPPDPRHDLA